MTKSFEMTGDLVRSQIRVQILEILKSRGRLTQRELRDELDCARTTVNRNQEQLQEYGWVEDTGNGYTITTTGEFVYEEASSLVKTIETTEHLKPILKYVSRDNLDIDIAKLRDAEIIGPAQNQSLTLVDRHIDDIKRSENYRMVSPVISRYPAEVVYDRAKAGNMRGEFIASPECIDTIKSDPEFTDLIKGILEGEFEMYIYEDEIPYFLGIFDSMVHIGIVSEGAPKALLKSESSEVRTWAEDKFAEYRAGAKPLSEWSPSDMF